MSDPVILIGTDEKGLAAVGLYETVEDAREAVHLGQVPSGPHYSVMTPPLGQTYSRRAPSPQIMAPEAEQLKRPLPDTEYVERWR